LKEKKKEDGGLISCKEGIDPIPVPFVISFEMNEGNQGWSGNRMPHLRVSYYQNHSFLRCVEPIRRGEKREIKSKENKVIRNQKNLR